MTTRTAETSPLVYARVAGFLYLLLLPTGIFGILYVPSTLIVPGDAAATSLTMPMLTLLLVDAPVRYSS